MVRICWVVAEIWALVMSSFVDQLVALILAWCPLRGKSSIKLHDLVFIMLAQWLSSTWHVHWLAVDMWKPNVLTCRRFHNLYKLLYTPQRPRHYHHWRDLAITLILWTLFFCARFCPYYIMCLFFQHFSVITPDQLNIVLCLMFAVRRTWHPMGGRRAAVVQVPPTSGLHHLH